MQSYDSRGSWFLPGTPDRVVRGILKYSPATGAELVIDGLLEDLDSPLELRRYDTILGTMDDGTEVTLYDTFMASVDTIVANQVFLGHHLRGRDEIRCLEIRAEYTHLNEWALLVGHDIWTGEQTRLSGIEVDYHQAPTEYRVLLTVPHHEVLYQSNRFTAYLEIVCTPPSLRAVQTDATVKQRAVIRLVFTDPTALDECDRLVVQIRDFVALASIRPVHVSSLQIMVPSEKPASRPWIDVLRAAASPVEDNKARHRMLFYYSQVRSRISDLLDQWFGKAELLEPVRALHSVMTYDRAGYLELEFISIVQALESYHRRFRQGRYVDDVVYSNHVLPALVGAIPIGNGISSEFRDTLKGRMRHLNEYSLKKRIKHILDELGADLCEGFIDSPKAFAQKVADTRNYLTHYSPGLKDSSATRSRLLVLALKLKIILELCLLGELGLTHDKIVGLFRECSKYQMSLKWFRELDADSRAQQ